MMRHRCIITNWPQAPLWLPRETSCHKFTNTHLPISVSACPGSTHHPDRTDLSFICVGHTPRKQRQLVCLVLYNIPTMLKKALISTGLQREPPGFDEYTRDNFQSNQNGLPAPANQPHVARRAIPRRRRRVISITEETDPGPREKSTATTSKGEEQGSSKR